MDVEWKISLQAENDEQLYNYGNDTCERDVLTIEIWYVVLRWWFLVFSSEDWGMSHPRLSECMRSILTLKLCMLTTCCMVVSQN